jgi:hypothetical protein
MDSKFLFLYELGICPQNPIYKTYETLRKTSFCTEGYVEIHKQWPFLDNKLGIGEILGMKIQTIYICFGALSTHGSFFLKNTKISIFGGLSKFFELIVFGQF